MLTLEKSWLADGITLAIYPSKSGACQSYLYLFVFDTNLRDFFPLNFVCFNKCLLFHELISKCLDSSVDLGCTPTYASRINQCVGACKGRI